VPAPGHEHDVTVALPGLAADPSVLATVVLAKYAPEPGVVPEALPEGFDARITFDRARARARRWPAIDPDRTSVRTYPDERHEHIARAARTTLAEYAALDPALALADPSSFDDPAAAERAQALVRYLAHSFRVVELFSALPAEETPMAEVLDTVEDLLGL
jgi:F0F1-type ATP synthase beta subunit